MHYEIKHVFDYQLHTILFITHLLLQNPRHFTHNALIFDILSHLRCYIESKWCQSSLYQYRYVRDLYKLRISAYGTVILSFCNGVRIATKM